MSASGLAQGKLRFRVIDGRRPNRPEEEYEGTRPMRYFFAAQTLAIVRHFFEISCQIGRLPSILGREFFRAKVSHHAIPSFEDQVGVRSRCGAGAGAAEPAGRRGDQPGGTVPVFAGGSGGDAGTQPKLRLAERFAESVDHLAEMFLASGMLRDDRPDRRLQRFSPEAAAVQESGIAAQETRLRRWQRRRSMT